MIYHRGSGRTRNGRSLPAPRSSASRGIYTTRSDDEWLHRCMRGDFADLCPCGGGQFEWTRQESQEKFVHMVLMAFAHGSTLTSPFLHTTRDIQVARKWYKVGRNNRGDRNYLVRVRRSLSPIDCVVDMSTQESQDSRSGSNSSSSSRTQRGA